MTITEAQIMHDLLSKGEVEAALQYVTQELNSKADHQIYVLMEKIMQWLPLASQHTRQQILQDLSIDKRDAIVYSSQAYHEIAKILGETVCHTCNEIRDICFGKHPREYSEFEIEALKATQIHYKDLPATQEDILDYFNNQMDEERTEA